MKFSSTLFSVISKDFDFISSIVHIMSHSAEIANSNAAGPGMSKPSDEA